MVVGFGRDDPGSPILESTDGGQTWREPQGNVPALKPNSLHAVATDGNGWVTVGFKSVSDDRFDGIAYFSPDGENWKPAKIKARNPLETVAGNGSRWVAIGHGLGVDRGVLSTSTDGMHWRTRNVKTELSDVAWNGTQWLIAGVKTHGFTRVEGEIWTSADGVHWSKHIYKHWDADAVGWNGNEWLTIGYGIHASTDGVHWTKRSDDNSFDEITWTGAQWVAVQTHIGDTGPGGAFVSPDGASWTPTLKKIGLARSRPPARRDDRNALVDPRRPTHAR